MAKTPTSQRLPGGSRIQFPAPPLGGLGNQVQRATQHMNSSGTWPGTQTLIGLRVSTTMGYAAGSQATGRVYLFETPLRPQT